jgi:hypothetical protein
MLVDGHCKFIGGTQKLKLRLLYGTIIATGIEENKSVVCKWCRKYFRIALGLSGE